jgi:hypothetical protein
MIIALLTIETGFDFDFDFGLQDPVVEAFKLTKLN